MSVRRTYHFNTNSAANKDGIYINDPCDFHFRQLGLYSAAPYGLDTDGTTRLGLGDKPGLKPNSASLPVEIIGGFHQQKTVVNTTPYSVTADDSLLLVYTSGGSITLNLPAISAVPGKILIIKKQDLANFITINRNGTDTIEGTLTSYIIGSLYKTVYLYADATSNSWYFVTDVRQVQNVYNNFSPSASSTSASYVTLYTSSSITWSGRPVFFSLNGTFWDNNGADEQFIAYMGIRFGSGTDFDVCKAISMFHDKNFPFSGSTVQTPSRGAATVDIRMKRVQGAGTFKQDNKDFITLDMIEL